MKDFKPYTFSKFAAEIKAETRVKIIHVLTKQFLHSSALKYSGGSGQQQVGAVEDQADQGNWWVVRSSDNTIHQKSVIRLTHQLSGANLHSHKGYKSPSTKQQEVSCFGVSGNGDQNDYWELRLDEDQNKQWGLDNNLRTGSYFSLKHRESEHYLHSHNGHFTQDHQQEVTAFNGKDENNLWYICVAE